MLYETLCLTRGHARHAAHHSWPAGCRLSPDRSCAVPGDDACPCGAAPIHHDAGGAVPAAAPSIQLQTYPGKEGPLVAFVAVDRKGATLVLEAHCEGRPARDDHRHGG